MWYQNILILCRKKRFKVFFLKIGSGISDMSNPDSDRALVSTTYSEFQRFKYLTFREIVNRSDQDKDL